MKLVCPSCGSAVKAADVNLDKLVAKCGACDNVFRFDPPFAQKAAPRAVPLPSGLKIVEQSRPLLSAGTYRTVEPGSVGTLVVERRWFGLQDIFMLFFSIMWDGFLFFWYSTALSAPGGLQPMLVLFPLLHVAVGVGMTYRAIAGLLNRTTVSVRDGRLTVRHGPLPWLGDRDLPTPSLRQLYVRSKTSRTKNGTRTSFKVCAENADRAEVVLVAGLTDRAQADYLEWVIEDHLGIENDPAYGD